MKATEKAPEIEQFLSALLGRSRTESIANDTCAICLQEIHGFKDPMSAKEYTISGMCQDCQDKVFK